MISLLKKNQPRGFTLVELLVTITIFTILTGVVLFSQSKFNSSILLTNLAYDTALTIRQAQNYGINIKEYDAGLFLPYGVHFDISSDKSFILFADHIYYSNSEKISPYDGSISSCDTAHGCVNRYNVKGGNSISNLCVYTTVDPSEMGCRPVQKLDIIFQRPNPDAKIFADIDGNVDDGYDIPNADSAEITVIGSDGSQQRRVRIQANGLIEILNN
jgi:prepilin-type N-terminal cleavage/methylation domain-containing protein